MVSIIKITSLIFVFCAAVDAVPTNNRKELGKTSAVLSCHVRGDSLTNLEWMKISDPNNTENLKELTDILYLNETHFATSFNFARDTRKSNGTYECRATDYSGFLSRKTYLLFLEAPEINVQEFDQAKTSDTIFAKQTIIHGDDPVTKYFIQQMKDENGYFQYYPDEIDGANSIYGSEGLRGETVVHQFRIVATNSLSSSQSALSELINHFGEEPGEITRIQGARVILGSSAILSCQMRGHNLTNINWIKHGDSDNIESLEKQTSISALNETHLITRLSFDSVARKDNGTYECRATDSSGVITSQTHLVVLEVPEVNIIFASGVGGNSAYLKWIIVTDGNDPVTRYYIQILKNGTEQWQYYPEEIDGGITRYQLEGLESNTDYRFRLVAVNSLGFSRPAYTSEWVTTLEKVPKFVPTISLNETRDTEFTIVWSWPPREKSDNVGWYEIVTIDNNGTTKEEGYLARLTKTYSIRKLQPETSYSVKVRGCRIGFDRRCGNWSTELKVRTKDKVPEFIPIITLNETRNTEITIVWSWPPIELYENIGRYEIMTIDHNGTMKEDRYPARLTKTYAIRDLQPGTSYSVKVRGCEIGFVEQCGSWSTELKVRTKDKDPECHNSESSIDANDDHSSDCETQVPNVDDTESATRLH